jgi:5'-nucleotidase
MADRRIDLARARILVTNDDGIAAPGLKLLEEIAHALAPDVWVVAPEQEQSGASHSLTTRRPLRLKEIAARRHAVDGTPTDCVMLATRYLLKDRTPDLVLSGINAGGNVGEDLTYSGTVAAAMEATLLGIPAIALSQNYSDGEAIPWPTAARFAPEVIRRLVELPWPEHTLMNVNFPAAAPQQVRGIVPTSQGKRAIADNLTKRFDPRGRPYYWIGPVRLAPRAERAGTPNENGIAEPDTDLAAIADTYVSVTPIYLDLTNVPVLAALKKVFG